MSCTGQRRPAGSRLWTPADQKVFDGIVQEIDIRTGQVLFQWDNADHVPYRDSENPRPASAATPWDWSYINAVHLDTDGNLLISSRFTWTVFKVSLRTGKIIWELGGKQSTFKLTAAPGRSSTPRARSSPTSTTPRPSGTTSAQCSTMSRAARRAAAL